MPNEDDQKKEHSKISLRIGEVQVELEGTSDNIRKLMDKELVDFAKGLEATTKQLPPSTENAPKVTPRSPEITPKTSEVAPKEKAVPPPPIKPSITTENSAKKSRLFSIGKKTEKTGKKKNGWKPAAIALVLVCIVLSAGLVSVLAVYLPMINDLESQVAEKDTNIAALTSQVTSLTSQVTSINSQLLLLQAESNTTISNLQEGIAILNSRIESYLQLLYLNVSTYLFADEPLTGQNASEYTVVFQDVLEYAGYVGVTVQSTSTTTYVQLLYSYSQVTYDHNVTVATNGAAYFPVLPGPVEIRVGNTDVYTGDLLNATVTAVYYY
ncbi:hypothetical protein JXA31_05450 [Candidatus Bathyarchaeota archaeon]|nr:hypothetical protein [Candidatus Bathyarchaeota archaeon]